MSTKLNETKTHHDTFDLSKLLSGPNQLNMLHINIRSIRQNFTKLLLLIEGLNGKNAALDIIILTETFKVEDTKIITLTVITCIIMRPHIIKMMEL